MIELECYDCWKKAGEGYDVDTLHTINSKDSTAKCSVCGCVQDVELR